jgi:hypothetical protein
MFAQREEAHRLDLRVREIAACRGHSVEDDRMRTVRHRTRLELDCGPLGVGRRGEEAPHGRAWQQLQRKLSGRVWRRGRLRHDHRDGQREERSTSAVGGVEGMHSGMVHSRCKLRRIHAHHKALAAAFLTRE